MYTEPLPRTWLPLERYAKIIGIPPQLFWGSVATDYLYYNNSCDSPVSRFAWQLPPQVSRWEIALEIQAAEREISEYLGYNLVPDFTHQQMVMYPLDYRRDSKAHWYGARGQKAISLGTGKIISGGIRAVTSIGTVDTSGGSIVYSDEDGDTFSETVTVSIATSVTDVAEVGVFYSGHDGEPEYEFGKPRQASISGGVYTAKYYIWQFVDPDIDARWPDVHGYQAIDLQTAANLIDELDVYRVYVDTTIQYVRIIAQDDYYLYPDQVRYVDGVFAIQDSEAGLVIPTPATYNEDEGTWGAVPCAITGPTNVRVSYYSGDMSPGYVARRTVDPLKEDYARAIAHLATARLKRPPCSCTEPLNIYTELSKDVSKASREGSHFLPKSILLCPFGTLAGEISAWRALNMLHSQRPDAAIL